MSHGDNRLDGHVSPISLLAQSNPSSLRRCREENDIFRYFDDMQSIIRGRKSNKNDRKKRKRNLAFDLVGVELNPGPNKKSGSAAKKMASRAPATQARKKAKKSVQPRSRGGDSLTGLSGDASRYLASVLAPCSGNARIPDMNTIPTSLMTLESEFSATVNSSGAVGVLCTLGTASGACTYYQTESSTSTDAAFLYNSSSPIAIGVGNVGFCRLVSACVDVIYTGTSQNDSGYLTGASFVAIASGGVTETVASNQGALSSSRVNKSVRTKDGISVFYRPGDSSSFDFAPFSLTTKLYGLLQVHGSGLTPATVLRCKFRANYENIATVDSVDYTTASVRSPVDVAGLGKAVVKMQEYSPVVDNKTASNWTSSLRDVFSTAVTYGPAVWNGLKTAASFI